MHAFCCLAFPWVARLASRMSFVWWHETSSHTRIRLDNDASLAKPGEAVAFSFGSTAELPGLRINSRSDRGGVLQRRGEGTFIEVLRGQSQEPYLGGWWHWHAPGSGIFLKLGASRKVMDYTCSRPRSAQAKAAYLAPFQTKSGVAECVLDWCMPVECATTNFSHAHHLWTKGGFKNHGFAHWFGASAPHAHTLSSLCPVLFFNRRPARAIRLTPFLDSGPIAPRVSAGDSPLSVQTRLARQQGFGVVVQWGGPHGSVDRWQSWGESRPRVIVRLPHFHSRRTILGPALLSSHPSVLGSAHGFYIRHFGDNIQCR